MPGAGYFNLLFSLFSRKKHTTSVLCQECLGRLLLLAHIFHKLAALRETAAGDNGMPEISPHKGQPHNIPLFRQKKNTMITASISSQYGDIIKGVHFILHKPHLHSHITRFGVVRIRQNRSPHIIGGLLSVLFLRIHVIIQVI